MRCAFMLDCYLEVNRLPRLQNATSDRGGVENDADQEKGSESDEELTGNVGAEEEALFYDEKLDELDQVVFLGSAFDP